MIDGCSADIINKADCGYAVDAGDVKSLSLYIRTVVMQDPAFFKSKGLNARAFFEKYYQKDRCIDNLEYYLSGCDIHTPPYETPSI